MGSRASLGRPPRQLQSLRALQPLLGPALLGVLVTVLLVQALLGGHWVGTPVALLACAAAGWLVGLRCAPPVVALVVTPAALALALAYQRDAPGEYPFLDDLVFALLVVGAPAVAGGVVRARAAQVRELDELAARLEQQRGTVRRTARLDERRRVLDLAHHRFAERLAAILVRTEGATAAPSPAAMADVEAAAREGLDELRAVLADLAEGDPPPEPPPVTEPPSRLGLLDVGVALACGALVALEAVVSPDAIGPPLLAAVLGLLAGASLVVRRTHAAWAVTGCLAALLAMAATVTPPTAMVTPILLLLMCGWSVGAHARGRHRVVAGAVLAVGVLAVFLVAPLGRRDGDGLTPTFVVLTVSLGVGVVAAGWAERAERRRAAGEEMRRGRDAEVALAVAEQRERLARELHDSVAHALTVVCLQASAAQVSADPAALEAILATARRGLVELRQGLDRDTGALGVAALTETAARAGLRPAVTVSGDLDGLSPRVRDLAARVVREALTNAGRYAPGARVEVTVEVGETLRVAVADSGSPHTEHTEPWRLGAGTGLTGLAEETAAAGGSLTWAPRDGGFALELALPATAEVSA